MKKVLFDINIFLDIFLERDDFYKGSAKVFAMVEQKQFHGYICSLTIPTLFYLLSKEFNRQKALIFIEKIRALFSVSTVDEKVIDLSIISEFKDIEDAVQYFSALDAKADYLITRNKKDFKKDDIPILTPEEFLVIKFD